MYNKLLFSNTKLNQSLELIFTKKEFDKIKNFFRWKLSKENLIINYNDKFNNHEIDKLIKVIPQIQDINISKFDFITWDDFNVRDFNLKKGILKDLIPIEPGPINNQYWSFSLPINGRQTQDYGDGKLYLWYNEFGAYEYYSKSENKSLGFYNSVTNRLIFCRIESYEKYLKNHQNLLEKLKFSLDMKKKQNYIRVICVYDKKTKELKYRILNSQFSIFPMLEFIKPIEGDDFLLKAYKIDKSLAERYFIYTNDKIDFDFTKNHYFFEAINCNEFVYNYNDFNKNLSVESESDTLILQSLPSKS